MIETSPVISLPVLRANSLRCATQHFGAWAIEPKWFRAAMDSIRAGTLKPSEPKVCDDDDDDFADGDEPLYAVENGVAVIHIDGQMTKRGSSFGGCSTVAVRQAMRTAKNDFAVRAIMLVICSPGGTVAGTSDLADDVVSVASEKPVDAYITDLGCSAAYWIASQCRTIYANSSALVGSIGTYSVLEDDTGLQEKVGIKYRLVTTGEYKGLGADGSVSDKLIADVQREINSLNALFLAGVSNGRGDKIADIPSVSDGRVWVAAQAKQLGLIDEVASFDAAMSALTQEVSMTTPQMNADAFKKYAAEHPDAVADFRNEGLEQGKKDGHAAGVQSERTRAKAINGACGDNHALAVESILAGHDPEAVKLAAKAAADATNRARADAEAAAAALAKKDEEIALLKEQATFNQGSQGAVAVRGKETAKPPEPGTDEEVEAAANETWSKMTASQKSEWIDQKSFVTLAKAEAKGLVRASKVG